MIVLKQQISVGRRLNCQFVMIFGLGLIGQSVKLSLDRSTKFTSSTFPFSWDSSKTREKQIKTILGYVNGHSNSYTCVEKIDVVIAAGKAGFANGVSVFTQEQESYDSIFSLIHSLSVKSDRTIRVHFISSAGGLFEGLCNVELTTKISPLRPYGIAKYQLERCVSELPDEIVKFIYRPSSVYGYNGIRGRVGLIVAALRSITENSTVRIYAKPDTLRDYVFVEDIGRFLALNVLDTQRQSQVYLLASGKPTSTLELVKHIERITGRRLSVQYELSEENSSSNTYRPCALPSYWRSTSLETGVYLTAMKIHQEMIAT